MLYKIGASFFKELQSCSPAAMCSILDSTGFLDLPLAFTGKEVYFTLIINPNKAGLFEGRFSLGGGRVNLSAPPPPPSYFKKNLSNFDETL